MVKFCIMCVGVKADNLTIDLRENIFCSLKWCSGVV